MQLLFRLVDGLERVIRVAALLSLGMGPALASGSVTRIAFGSCAHQDRPAPIFEAIVESAPDVFIWMGDNVYADTLDPEKMARDYKRQFSRPAYQKLRAGARILGTWDDHDFGANDAGREFPGKDFAQPLLLDFLEVPTDDPRREREGVYAAETLGEGDQSIKVILLDTRYFRESPGPDADILGEAQWQWLERELVGSTAAIHLLVSSIQVLPTEHRFEKWANFPQARERLLALLSREDVPPVLILSGDRHMAEISREALAPMGESTRQLIEVTSSSLTNPSGGSATEPNRRRLGLPYRPVNFGLLTVDWNGPQPVVVAAIHDVDGKVVRAMTVAF